MHRHHFQYCLISCSLRPVLLILFSFLAFSPQPVNFRPVLLRLSSSACLCTFNLSFPAYISTSVCSSRFIPSSLNSVFFSLFAARNLSPSVSRPQPLQLNRFSCPLYPVLLRFLSCLCSSLSSLASSLSDTHHTVSVYRTKHMGLVSVIFLLKLLFHKMF